MSQGRGSQGIPKRFSNPETGATYEIGDHIGSGAAAVVHKCHLISTGEVFAVKIISVGAIKLRSDESRERNKMRNEVGILRKMSHPCIVNLLEVVETQDYIYLVMEYISGGELFQKIVEQDAGFSEDQARYAMRQLIEAVRYMHTRRVIHRDIKPENILVAGTAYEIQSDPQSLTPPQPFYHVKVADFGLAKVVQSGSAARTFVGTPQYWAPEVIMAGRSGTTYTTAADVWSLGVVLYVMIGRVYPFNAEAGDDASSMDARICAGAFHYRYTTFANASQEVRDLIRKLMTVDPEQRITLDQALNHPWFKMPPKVHIPSLPPMDPAYARTSTLPFTPPAHNGGIQQHMQANPVIVRGPILAAANTAEKKFDAQLENLSCDNAIPQQQLQQLDIFAKNIGPEFQLLDQFGAAGNQQQLMQMMMLMQQQQQQQQQQNGGNNSNNLMLQMMVQQQQMLLVSLLQQQQQQQQQRGKAAALGGGVGDMTGGEVKLTPGDATAVGGGSGVSNAANSSPKVVELSSSSTSNGGVASRSRVVVPPPSMAKKKKNNTNKRVNRMIIQQSSSSDHRSTSSSSSSSSDSSSTSASFEAKQAAAKKKEKRLGDLKELHELQTRIATRFQLAYLAFRKSPGLARAIRRQALACRDVQREAAVVVGKFAVTCRSVLDVLPDLQAAVEHQLLDVAVQMLGDIREWVLAMRSDGETVQKAYSGLTKALHELIEEARDAKHLVDSKVGSGGLEAIMPAAEDVEELHAARQAAQGLVRNGELTAKLMLNLFKDSQCTCEQKNGGEGVQESNGSMPKGEGAKNKGDGGLGDKINKSGETGGRSTPCEACCAKKAASSASSTSSTAGGASSASERLPTGVLMADFELEDLLFLGSSAANVASLKKSLGVTTFGPSDTKDICSGTGRCTIEEVFDCPLQAAAAAAASAASNNCMQPQQQQSPDTPCRIMTHNSDETKSLITNRVATATSCSTGARSASPKAGAPSSRLLVDGQQYLAPYTPQPTRSVTTAAMELDTEEEEAGARHRENGETYNTVRDGTQGGVCVSGEEEELPQSQVGESVASSQPQSATAQQPSSSKVIAVNNKGVGGPNSAAAAAAAAAAESLRRSALLVKALQELRQVDLIIGRFCTFWSSLDATIERLSQLKTHTERMMSVAHVPAMKPRFNARLKEYSEFWEALSELCEDYGIQVAYRAQEADAFVVSVDDAADRLDTWAAHNSKLAATAPPLQLKNLEKVVATPQPQSASSRPA